MTHVRELNSRSFTLKEQVKTSMENQTRKTKIHSAMGYKTMVALVAILAVLLFTACEEDAPGIQNQDESILPSKFKVDIPASLSEKNTFKNASLKSAEADTLKGNEIYENLKYFIAIGEGAADIAESIIWSISAHNIQRISELTFTSDDDNRIKHLVVKQEVEFDKRTWEYQLTMTDLETEGNADGGMGMQVFWNSSPVEGIALIKPMNLNHNDTDDAGQAMYSIEYSEKKMGEYDAHMIVQIADFPTSNFERDIYAVSAIKLFVGKKGDIVDVYGNSNHPNAKFFTDETGFNWAFVASGTESKDIAVAEVALPPSTLNSNDRNEILKDYSIKNVFTEQINIWILDAYGFRPDSTDLAGYLVNADAPGYFNNDGFIQGGIAPNNQYGELEERLLGLTPYNPMEISELKINFKE